MYEFRPMTVDDLARVRQWLTAPHVAQWWGDPGEQFALVSGDLDHPDMAQFIVELHRRPFAYLQSYDLTAWDSGFGRQPWGTRGIDQFIGEPDMIGRGHGSAFIRCVRRPADRGRRAAHPHRPRPGQWPRRARL